MTRDDEQVSLLRTFYYWLLLLLSLILIDDLAVAWIFWAIAQIDPWLSASIALLSSWLLGWWLTVRGLKSNPGELARSLLRGLRLERKNPELAERERQLMRRVRSVAIALPMSLLFGGIITTLYLRRHEVVNDRQGFWLGGALAFMYACEFAAIHGLGIGGGLFSLWHQ